MQLALFALGYLSGSIPFGLLLTSWIAGKDVRALGSGNIGATNVARVAGRRLGVLVLLLDGAKGALPVLAAMRVWPEASWLHAGVGLCAFLGHVFPIWLRFKGGKGVATGLGVLAVLLPEAALVGGAVYVLALALFRIGSVASLAGALSAVVTGLLLGRSTVYAGLAVLLFTGMLLTHRENLRRLRKGSEPKL